ncbi:MAG: hypothetical protein ACMXYK_02350 [Candidatus Woesearchaeota archaeon]
MKTCGDFLDLTFKKILANKKTIGLLGLFFILIPQAIQSIFQFIRPPPEFDPLTTSIRAFLIQEIVIVHAILGVMTTIFMIFFGLSIVHLALDNKKQSHKELITKSKNRILQYLGFVLVIYILIMILLLLFVIPGIIFIVYWGFASYVFIAKKSSIGTALKESKDLVTGKWWLTFGYFLLIGLIGFGIIGLITIVSNIFLLIPSIGPILVQISASIGTVIANAIMFIFYGEIYKEWSKETKKAQTSPKK